MNDNQGTKNDFIREQIKEKPLNKKYKIEGKGLCLLNYLFNRHFLNKDDYIEEYEKTKAIIKLMEKLAEGEKSAKENGWLSNDDVKAALGV